MSSAREYRNYSARARKIARVLDLVASGVGPILRRVAPRGVAPYPPRSILVVRLDHLGDVLMSTPALASLRRAFPAARIDVLAARWGAAALEGNPDLSGVREAVAPWYDPRESGLPRAAALRAARALRRGEAYDWAFDLRGDPRIVLLYLLPLARRRFGFSRLGLEGLLTDAIPYVRRRSMLDSALDLAAAAGAPAVGRRPVYRTDDAARARAAQLLAEVGVPEGAPIAIVAPAANRPPARFHAEGFGAVSDGLAAAGLHVVLVGRLEDRAVTGLVSERSSRPLLDLAGRTTLRELAALLEAAALLVANDSGPSHLAAAVDCPTIAIFGPTDPELTFPYEDGSRFVSIARPIDHERPCFDPRCTSDHGFSRIAPRDVLEQALRVARRVSPARDGA